MYAEHNLRDCFDQGVELSVWVIPPVAVVCEIPGELRCSLFSAQHLLSGLDALLGANKRHMACLARGIKHGLLERRLHAGHWVYWEGGRHDVLVALVVPFEGVAVAVAVVVVFQAASSSLGWLSKGNHGRHDARAAVSAVRSEGRDVT